MLRPLMVAVLLSYGAVGAAQSDPVAQAVDLQQGNQKRSRASQERIDRLDDQTKNLLEKYRASLWETQQLNVYADQLQQLVEEQEREQKSLQLQLKEVELTEREILPLMLRMLESLEKFVALDLPFLNQERQERLANLKKLMADPEAGIADRFRRLLEAYQVESDYGRALGAERTEVEIQGQRRSVHLLHVGRVALYYLSLDGNEAGRWNHAAKRWEQVDSGYATAVRRGVKIARETAAASLLVLPLDPDGVMP